MHRRLDGKAALVTGASRGIGRVTALRLANEGARVIVNYSASELVAQAVVDEITSAGGHAIAIRADVRDRTAVDTLVARAIGEFGAIDILVNNAGTLVLGSVLTMQPGDLARAMQINVEAAINCVQATVPQMIARRSGKIVNVCATSAIGTSVKGIAPHVASKSALLLLSKTLAQELGPHNINVNAVLPGAIDTEVTLPGGELYEALQPVRKAQLAHTLLGRIGTAHNVAAAIAFLVSDDAAFITAQALSIDGGRTDFLSHSA